jgi:hypothetical protein
MNNNRNLKIEDAISPMIERAKIAYLTFEERVTLFNGKWEQPTEEMLAPGREEFDRLRAELSNRIADPVNARYPVFVDDAKSTIASMDEDGSDVFSTRLGRQEEWTTILNDGRPQRAEIKLAFCGKGLGKITHDEARAVIIRCFLRDTPEDTTTEFSELGQFQKLARVVSSWIMDAFDDACMMTEGEAEDWLASTRPHSIAG